MKKIGNFINKNSTKIVLISVFLLILLLNILTPLLADDYSYALKINGKRIKNVLDIFNFQLNHYLKWGGRTLVHSIAQIFLMMPKAIFNISNSLIYILFLYTIYLIIKGNNKKYSFMLILINFVIFFSLPVYGENTIWLIGSCNYLWATTFILLFIYIYTNNNYKKNNKWKNLLIFLFGIVVGWSNENTSFGLISILTTYLVIDKIKNTKISKFKICGLIGVIIGFAIMILAPGNYVRASKFNENTNIIIKIVRNIINYTISAIDYMWIPIIATIVLIIYYIYNRKKINFNFYPYIIGSFFSIYSMVLSPEFPERSWMGPIIFLIIADGILIYNLLNEKFIKYVVINFTIILSIFYMREYLVLVKDINVVRKTWNYRIETINRGKKQNKKEFEFYYLDTKNTKAPHYGLADLSDNPKGWPNLAIEYYYKIDSIKIKK